MIYILVPTHSRVEETKKFLKSISKSIKDNYLIIIIDDHPDKNTFKSIQQNNKIKVFQSNKELCGSVVLTWN